MDRVWGKSNPSRRLPGREKEEEMALSIRRIFLVLAIAAVMAAMVTVSAVPASAQDYYDDCGLSACLEIIG
jgi:hypothetical protein